MPRYYNQGEHVSPAGWSQRAANAAAMAEMVEANQNDPDRIERDAGLRIVSAVESARQAFTKAEAHRVTLQTKLNTAISTAARMDSEAYRQGVMSDGRPRVQAQIQAIPGLIERSAAEIVEAKATLARAQDVLDSHNASVAAKAAPVSKRGAGR